MFVNLEPLVGALLGVIVLGESLGPGALLGGVAVMASALVVSLPEERQDERRTSKEAEAHTCPTEGAGRC